MSLVRFLILALVAVSHFVVPPAAFAQPVPVGPEFQVNTYTTDSQSTGQYARAVAMDGAGNFLVVWGSFGGAGTDTDGTSIQAQRYDVSGAPLGAQFQVNTYTTSYQFFPEVAANSAGNFVVTWNSVGSGGTDTDGYSVQAQRYDSTGAPQGGQFQVNTYTTINQRDAMVAIDGAGNFVVAWQSLGSAGTDTSSYSVHARRYDSTGTPQSDEFQVNTYTSSVQRHPSVAADGAGNFVVVWDGFASVPSDGFGIQGQRFDSTGNPQGSQFQVNTYTTAAQLYPFVAADAAGNFVVVWTSRGGVGSDDMDSYSIQGQRFDSAASPLGAQFQVNTYTTNSQGDPMVAMDGAGNFVVVWSSSGSAGTDTDYGYSVQGQRFDSTGNPQGSQFQVNTYTTDDQRFPSVATDGAGNIVVTWSSNGSAGTDTDGSSVQAQRFAVSTTSSTSTTSTTSTSTLPTTDLLPGRLAAVDLGTLAKFVAKPAVGDSFTLPTANPVLVGGSLRIFDTGSAAGDNSYGLPAAAPAPFGWLALGNPPGSRGYRYRGAGNAADPCKVVLVKGNTIRALCRGAGITLQPPFAGGIGIVLSFGTTDRYCAQFGGSELMNTADGTKRKNAPAPGACP